MAFPAMRDPNHVPLNVLFPEAYEKSARTIALDFVFFGALIVGGIVLAAAVNLLTSP